MMSGNVTNEYTFDADDFIEYYVKGQPRFPWHRDVVTIAAMVVLGPLPVAGGFLIMGIPGIGSGLFALGVLLVALPVWALLVSIAGLYRFYHPKFKEDATVARCFDQLKNDGMISLYDDMPGRIRKGFRALRDKGELRAFVESVGSLEAPVSVRIGEGGVYMEHADRYFATDFSSIASVMKTKRLCILRDEKMRDLPLRKDAFKGAVYEQVERYVEARRRGGVAASDSDTTIG